MAVDRLPIDSFLKGYWGFDEANETDPALDESSTGQNLTVHSAPSTRPGRVNNGRQFDGSTTFADAASQTPYDLAGDLTLIAWPTLDSVNTGGSMLRCIVSFNGSTSTAADNTQYALFIDSTGAIVYHHEYGAGVLVEMRTGPGTFLVQRYGSVALVRKSAGSGICKAHVYLNNVLIPWATITVGGVSQTLTDPVANPDGGSTATFQIGKSSKISDGSFWQGVIDELSVHSIARTQSPYLTAAFYRVALNPSLARLSAFNSVRSIGSAEMGGGSRWWTYERDQNLYVVREQPLGYFTEEIQLTTGGTGSNGAPVPGQVTQPELVYDSSTDTLVVFWLAGGRGYKLTATSGDAPSTQNMPYTSDTTSVIKVHDQSESVRLTTGGGSSGNDLRGTTFDYSNDGIASISFIMAPTFGLGISPLQGPVYGYSVYQILGGVEAFLGVATGYVPGSGGYFWPITSRQFGAQYVVRPLDQQGNVSNRTFRSNIITDVLGQFSQYVTGNLFAGHDGNIIDNYAMGSGAPVAVSWNDSRSPNVFQFTNRSPLKIAFNDIGDHSLGVGSPVETFDCDPTSPFQISFINRTPLKIQYGDPDVNQMGIGSPAGGMSMGSTGRSVYQT